MTEMNHGNEIGNLRKLWAEAVLSEYKADYFKAVVGAGFLKIGGTRLKAKDLIVRHLNVKLQTADSILEKARALSHFPSSEDWESIGWSAIRDLVRVNKTSKRVVAKVKRIARDNGKRVYKSDLIEAGILPKPKPRKKRATGTSEDVKALRALLADTKGKLKAAEAKAKAAEERAKTAEAKLAAILQTIGQVA